MEHIYIAFGFFLALFLIFAWFGTKIIDWYEIRRGSSKTRFISDLYKIQIRYAKLGETAFSELVDLTIKSAHAAPERNEPEFGAKTEYGKSLIEGFKANYKEKVKMEIIRELNDEME